MPLLLASPSSIEGHRDSNPRYGINDNIRSGTITELLNGVGITNKHVTILPLEHSKFFSSLIDLRMVGLSAKNGGTKTTDLHPDQIANFFRQIRPKNFAEAVENIEMADFHGKLRLEVVNTYETSHELEKRLHPQGVQ